MKRAFPSSLVGIGLLAWIGQAQASVLVADLNTTQVSNFPSGTLGTVTITDWSGLDAATGISGNYVKVEVKLIDNFNFVNTGNNTHIPFAFNLDIAPTGYDVSTAHFAWAGPSVANPYGTFTNGITMDTAQGQGGSLHGPLDFTVDGVSVLDFEKLSTAPHNGGGNSYFAFDVVCMAQLACDSSTATVAAQSFTYRSAPTLTSPIPESSTWAMMILGFAGVGFIAYRRKRDGSALATV
jgi:hypothetical protein